MKPEKIAQIAHRANQGLQTVIPNPSVPVAPDWDLLKANERKTVVDGVKLLIENDNWAAADSHEAWSEAKEADGWVYGPVKDSDAKTHPNLVPYHELPESEQAKDRLFIGIVRALADAPDTMIGQPSGSA